jgi:hypothetical protein
VLRRQELDPVQELPPNGDLESVADLPI